MKFDKFAWRILQIKCTEKFWDLLWLWNHLKQWCWTVSDIPVSASTSDIQGINIRLINENLGDKIMFFRWYQDFHTSQKMNKHSLDMHCRLRYVKYFNLRRKVFDSWNLIFPSSFNRLYLQHVLNKTRGLLCATSFNFTQATWCRAPTESFNAQTHVIKSSTGCL